MALSDPARAILVVLKHDGPMTIDELDGRVPDAGRWIAGLEDAGTVEKVGEGWRYLAGLG
jgi:Zn-dependent alcohol dehydrogenase